LREFERVRASGVLDRQAEMAARTWIERFLVIFGWDPGDPTQVVQEFRIPGRDALKMKAIGSGHRRPDYALLRAGRPEL
jgi:hypothetical protein